jgi:putative mycofactocin binding protein MftB
VEILKRRTAGNPTFWKKSKLKILQWMVSAVSTEPATYTVSPSVRVRKEAFGLLFYNTEDSRLTFVRSGDILQIKTLPNGAKRIEAGLEPEAQTRVRKLLDHLFKKRLIGGS